MIPFIIVKGVYMSQYHHPAEVGQRSVPEADALHPAFRGEIPYFSPVRVGVNVPEEEYLVLPQ